MGYETHFRLKGEIDPKFKFWGNDEPNDIKIKKQKEILVATCMHLPIKGENDEVSLTKQYDKVSFALRLYIAYIVEKWKFFIKERLDNEKSEIYFCGWQFSNRDGNAWTEESLEEYFTKNLFQLAIWDVGSPFDENTDRYYKKLEQITGYVDDIEDCVWDLWDRMFIDRYRDSEDAYESDGYSHRFPDETDDEEDNEVEDEYAVMTKKGIWAEKEDLDKADEEDND